MKALFAKLFGTKQNAQPRELTDIVSSFETQMIELDTRVQFDADLIEKNKAKVKSLEATNATKAKDIERANRIKSKIASFIE